MQIKWSKPIDVKTDKTLGYQYFLDRTHPLANSQGKVYYHRHVASLVIGRWVEPHEHVHHKDGDRSNNLVENLEVLTQAEHARHHHSEARVFDPVVCPVCTTEFVPYYDGAICCSDRCSRKRQRKFDPTREELEKLVWQMPSTKVAEHYGVCSSAIVKRCKKLGISKPGRGYWAKQNKGS